MLSFSSYSFTSISAFSYNVFCSISKIFDVHSIFLFQIWKM